jgi:preprotein translocase subunit SecG
MEKIEVKNKNQKLAKFAWLLVFIFATILTLSFFNGEKIHEKAVLNEKGSETVR